ncbi:MAG TPA: SDR family NAD(P)-dependent oxidoreductase, partial [Rhizomicrobium sp.]|nr:SDR family NAD(P)-dependent oxidoreductase [Rhizomicrobium sp.]
GKLDAFLGNAGVLGALTPLAQLEPKLFTELTDINITANWRLIRSLDPLLRQSEAGRALFITSGAARKHTPYWGGYAMSKAALESLALTYAAECNGTKVKVNLLNPGPIRTAMRAKAMPGEDPSSLKRPEELAPLIVELLSPANERNGELVSFQG